VAEGVTVASKALSITSFPHSASEPKPRLLRLKRKSTGNRTQLRTLWDISKAIFKTVIQKLPVIDALKVQSQWIRRSTVEGE
jgi:hypothetical protein